MRGGAWPYDPRHCRSVLRVHGKPDKADDDISFRLSCSNSPSFLPMASPSTTSSALEALQALGLVLKDIPAGSFLMGSPEDEPGRYSDEGPQQWPRQHNLEHITA